MMMIIHGVWVVVCKTNLLILAYILPFFFVQDCVQVSPNCISYGCAKSDKVKQTNKDQYTNSCTLSRFLTCIIPHIHKEPLHHSNSYSYFQTAPYPYPILHSLIHSLIHSFKPPFLLLSMHPRTNLILLCTTTHPLHSTSLLAIIVFSIIRFGHTFWWRNREEKIERKRKENHAFCRSEDSIRDVAETELRRRRTKDIADTKRLCAELEIGGEKNWRWETRG